MKKAFSVLTAGLLLLGALAAFAGCASEIKDEAVVAKVYEAIENAEITRFEVTSTIELKLNSVDRNGTIKNTTKQESTIKAYEEDGELFADIFTNEYSRTKSKSAASKVTTTDETYSVNFVRGFETYSTSGEWKKAGVKTGNFPALVKQLKQKDEVLKGAYQLPSLGLDGEDVQSFGKFARKVGAKTYKDGSGYFVKFDAEKLLEKEDDLLEGLIGNDSAQGADIDGNFTVYVDSRFEVTSVSVELDLSATENTSATSKLSLDIEFEMELKVRMRNPELTDLTGLKADMGRRLFPTQYSFPEEEVAMRSTLGNRIEGYCSGTATITEDNKLIVEVTFRGKNDEFSWTKSRKYDLQVNNDDDEPFFIGHDYKPYEKVEDGIRYSLVTYNNGHMIGTLALAKNFMQLIPEDYIKEL